MSHDQLRAFLVRVSQDAALQEQLEVAMDVDAVVAVARGAGFDVSSEELLELEADDGPGQPAVLVVPVA